MGGVITAGPGAGGPKVSQDVANYRPATGNDSCSVCKHFLPPDACELVDGMISPGGVSDLFERAAGTAPDAQSVLDAFMTGVSPNAT